MTNSLILDLELVFSAICHPLHSIYSSLIFSHYLLNVPCAFVLRPFNPVTLYFYFPLLHYLPLSIKVYHFPICWNISAFLPVVPYPSFHFSLYLSISSSRVPSHHASFHRVLRSTEKIGGDSNQPLGDGKLKRSISSLPWSFSFL